MKRSSWIIWMVPKANDKGPYRRWSRKRQTQKRRQSEDKGWDQSDKATIQAMPMNALECIAHQRLWRTRGWANTLILDFWCLELSESKFLLFQSTKFVAMCCTSYRKLTQRDMKLLACGFRASHTRYWHTLCKIASHHVVALLFPLL